MAMEKKKNLKKNNHKKKKVLINLNQKISLGLIMMAFPGIIFR